MSHVVCDNNEKAKQLLENADNLTSLKCIIVMETINDQTRVLAEKTKIKLTQFLDLEVRMNFKVKQTKLAY